MMDKARTKLECKKSVIRNPEQTKPKTVVIMQPEISKPTVRCAPKVRTASVVNRTSNNTKLNSPELYSALQIARKIETVENLKPRKVKSISDIDKKASVIDGKATKQLNFPYNQPIYKDLIPLCVNTKPQPIPSISREILIKDKEPILSDFFTPKTLPEYSFQVPIQSKQNVLTRQFDSFKLYRTIRNWK